MICGKLCFVQFLTSQGYILKLIYVGAAVNANVFQARGCGAGSNRAALKVVVVEPRSVGPSPDT